MVCAYAAQLQRPSSRSQAQLALPNPARAPKPGPRSQTRPALPNPTQSSPLQLLTIRQIWSSPTEKNFYFSRGNTIYRLPDPHPTPGKASSPWRVLESAYHRPSPPLNNTVRSTRGNY